jgi:hypothetical protein
MPELGCEMGYCLRFRMAKVESQSLIRHGEGNCDIFQWEGATCLWPNQAILMGLCNPNSGGNYGHPGDELVLGDIAHLF